MANTYLADLVFQTNKNHSVKIAGLPGVRRMVVLEDGGEKVVPDPRIHCLGGKRYAKK